MQMTHEEIVERAIGQPIKGQADCYRVNECAADLAAGTRIFPQGEDGPCFVKERFTDPILGVEVGRWRHESGQPASLRRVLG